MEDQLQNLTTELLQNDVIIINKEENQQEDDFYESNEDYFIDCCRDNDLDGIRECIQEGVDILWFDNNLNNGFHMACANGHIQVLKLLIQTMQDKNTPPEQQQKLINHLNCDRQTPLHWSVINEQKEIIEYLISLNVDCNLKNQNNLNAFEEAQFLQKSEIAEILARVTKPDLDDYKDVQNENFIVKITQEDQEDLDEINEEQKVEEQKVEDQKVEEQIINN